VGVVIVQKNNSSRFFHPDYTVGPGI